MYLGTTDAAAKGDCQGMVAPCSLLVKSMLACMASNISNVRATDRCQRQTPDPRHTLRAVPLDNKIVLRKIAQPALGCYIT